MPQLQGISKRVSGCVSFVSYDLKEFCADKIRAVKYIELIG